MQIDTINVIERCHHHILFSRIPGYRRSDLAHEQSVAKSVFEYWTHALAYVPIGDFRFYLPRMLTERRNPQRWGQTVDRKDYRRVIKMIRDGGPITIRDIEDEVLVEKEHLWASRKPSKGALQRAFWDGVLTTSARTGMLRTYELTDRHFGWDTMPKPATERQIVELPARHRDPRPGHRQHRFGRPHPHQCAAAGEGADRGAGAQEGAGAGRSRGRRQDPALGAAGAARGRTRRRRNWSTSSRRSIR